MKEHMRVLGQIALVTAIVGGGTAALVARWTEREQVSGSATAPTSVTTIYQGSLNESATTREPVAPETPRAPPEPSVSFETPPRVESPPPEPRGDTPTIADAVVRLAEEAQRLAAQTNEQARAVADAMPAASSPPAEETETADALAVAQPTPVSVDGGAPPPAAPAPPGPSFAAGAGRFATEAPPWAASSWASDPNAGAGRFTTEAPPWAASAWTSDPNAGAGAFTTDRSAPAPIHPISPLLLLPLLR